MSTTVPPNSHSPVVSRPEDAACRLAPSLAACGRWLALALVAGFTLAAQAQAPVITSFGRNGELVCTNLQPGSTASVVWASSVLGPWTNCEGLDAVTADSNGAIRVNVPMLSVNVSAFYRVRGVPAPAGMALIPAGPFTMGNCMDPNEGTPDELPLHTNQISAFYMDRTEVTKALWDEVRTWANTNGYDLGTIGDGKATNHPVHSVNWYDAVKWCNARSEKEGRVPAYYTSASLTTVYRTGSVDVQNSLVKWSSGYRLPTEAEWEKAARGGVSGQRFPWGDTISWSLANYYTCSPGQYSYDLNLTSGYHPTFATGDAPYTSPVGYFAPNDYGLYDMAGNLHEWTWDWGGSYTASPATDPRGPTSGSNRVNRGGAWFGNGLAPYCRAAGRGSNSTWYRSDWIGFRSVLPAPPPPPPPPPVGMVLIPAGPFTMGNCMDPNEGSSWELPLHTNQISAFYMDRTEVTKALWDEVRTWANTNGYDLGTIGDGKATNHPVHSVSWYAVVKWCNARSEKEGRVPAYYTEAGQTGVYRTGETNVENDWVKWSSGYRLPTEAEWEKAARGGVSGQRFPWGNTICWTNANYRTAWPGSLSYDLNLTGVFHPTFATEGLPFTNPVGYFEPNGYGLYDMAGNLEEWTWDWCGDYYTASPATDPRGPNSGSARVIRGGNWDDSAIYCRLTYRYGYGPSSIRLGFRSVLPAPPPTTAGMVLIPEGPFTMGNCMDPAEGWSEELPLHTNQISAFYMDRTEVTKALWDEVRMWANTNGYDLGTIGDGKATNHPVHSVSWYDVVKWCNARSEKEGRVPAYYTEAGQSAVYRSGETNVQNDWVKWGSGYRLPTEAEWEKAARGGVSGQRFPWSDPNNITHSLANYYSTNSYAYDTSPTRGFHPSFQSGGVPYTSPVGCFEPNGYGLYDMAGNVYEWTWDWFGYYTALPASDPRGPTSGSRRLLRGGRWDSSAYYCRSANRGYGEPSIQRNFLGFRSVLPMPPAGMALIPAGL